MDTNKHSKKESLKKQRHRKKEIIAVTVKIKLLKNRNKTVGSVIAEQLETCTI